MTKLVGILLGAGAAAVVAIAGCYNTNNIKSGGLVCGANDACPDGFHCEKDGLSGASGHCYRNGSGLLSDGGAKTDAVTGPACVTPVAPFGPFAACTATLPTNTSACDPVCQSGCACDRRCVVEGTTYDRFVCETSTQAPSTFVPVQGDCSGDKYASCAPGSVCIADDICPWQCFRACRQDGDCPKNSSCSVLTLVDTADQPVPNVWLCTPPTEVCNPTGTAACASARAGFACVFLAGLTTLTTDATVCDCATMHTKRVGTTCTRAPGEPDQCQAGAACVDGICRQVCDRQASGQACSSGGCNPLYGSARWGYCR